MFRRKTKLDVALPKPPTRDEILEDLEFFSLDRVLLSKDRRQSSVTGLNVLSKSRQEKTKPKADESNEEDKELDLWWQKFEEFLNDVDDLESYRKEFNSKKTYLNKLDEEIVRVSQSTDTSIRKGIDDAKEQSTQYDDLE